MNADYESSIAIVSREKSSDYYGNLYLKRRKRHEERKEDQHA